MSFALSINVNTSIIFLPETHHARTSVLYRRALEGFAEALGKEHEQTMDCAENFRCCLEDSGSMDSLKELMAEYYPNEE